MTLQGVHARPRTVLGGSLLGRIGRIAGVSLLLTMLSASFVGTESTDARAPAKYFVEETGHVIAEPFLSGWIARDGMTRLGLPVSEQDDANDRLVQYFEFGYLKSRSDSNDVKDLRLHRAGVEVLNVQHHPERVAAGRRVGGSRTSEAFLRAADGTGFKLAGRTETYFERRGGETRFGEPISNEYVAFGKRVQWFEYGRLEWSVVDKKVSAAPIGWELATARGVDLSPVDGDGLPDFDPKRFRTFKGDGVVPNASKPFSPVSIQIPKIRVNASIERVGIEQGVMGTPANAWNVGWYDGLSQPGDWTNVVMAGHRDWWNLGPVVFYNLGQLVEGDKIYLLGSDGKGSTYVVKNAWSVGADINANTIIGDSGAEMLTLITCDGAFNGAEYESRRIVQAERI